jgi:UDP-2,4-diacetamido-2,4,6-trideoxy-beta-L-altropyranose hydrolase
MEIELKRILFRCDSSSTIGLGHVKRCLVLAKRLKELNKNLEIFFSTLDLEGNINFEILKEGFSIYSLKDDSVSSLDYVIKGLSIDFLVIDSYKIDITFETQLKLNNNSLKIMSFDDILNSHNVDFILNHVIQAKKHIYKELVPKNCKILCGNEYTLLRDEFFKKYNNKKIEKNSVAIILGGNDVLNLSLKVALFLLEINSKYKVSVITTRVNPHLKELRKNKNIELLVESDNIAEVLSTKELVITASGGTLFEVLAKKKDFINIEIVSNQNDITNFLEKKGVKTTIKAENLSLKELEKKIEYINKKDVYKKLDLKFSRDKLVKKILKEIK